MAAKSRRKRPNLFRNNQVTYASGAIASEPINQNRLSQLEKVETDSSPNNKNGVKTALDLSYVGSEIKWIGIVAVIIIILLAIAYFIFH